MFVKRLPIVDQVLLLHVKRKSCKTSVQIVHTHNHFGILRASVY